MDMRAPRESELSSDLFMATGKKINQKVFKSSDRTTLALLDYGFWFQLPKGAGRLKYSGIMKPFSLWFEQKDSIFKC